MPPISLPGVARLAVLGLTTLLAGCSPSVGGVKLVPVAGVVRVDGAPLTTGTLAFQPDFSRGNTGTLIAGAEINADGTYTLYTAGKKGAPAGWYKVIVIAAEPMDPEQPYAKRHSFIDEKYNAVETTDLVREVTENPASGAYDLDLNK